MKLEATKTTLLVAVVEMRMDNMMLNHPASGIGGVTNSSVNNRSLHQEQMAQEQVVVLQHTHLILIPLVVMVVME